MKNNGRDRTWLVFILVGIFAVGCAPTVDLADAPELRLEKAGIVAKMGIKSHPTMDIPQQKPRE